MARGNPIQLSLPPFDGVVRRIVLANVAAFFALALVGLFSEPAWQWLFLHLGLMPVDTVSHGELWQLVTYSFLNPGMLQAIFNLLSIWLIGSYLQSTTGSRWLCELYFVSVIGAALGTVGLCYIPFLQAHLGLRTSIPFSGAEGAVFGLLVAFAIYFGEQEILFLFVIRMKAKYLVAIYLIIALASILRGGYGYLGYLGGGLAAWLYVKLAPRRGLLFRSSQWYFGLRNNYYRFKRRRAARKFEVYMGKQGRKLHFDKEGRYVDPDAKRDPNDKKWMN